MVYHELSAPLYREALKEVFQKKQDATKVIKNSNIVIEDSVSSIINIESVIEGYIKKTGCAPVVFIDNLQMFNSNTKEGLYVLNEGVRDIMDVKVYVFTPLDVIKDRWYKRAVSRGKTGEAADLQFKNVNETAQQYIRPNYLIADCIINGMVDKEYIKVITDKIMTKLGEICDSSF